MSVKEREREELQERAATFNPSGYDYENAHEHPPALDRFYGPLKNYVEMITGGYSNLLMLDAPGGLGKTFNTKQVLREQLDPNEWTHEKGFTTPVELYKTLWKAREKGHVLFLDDMSGIRNRQKAIDMLKAATETDGPENWITYRSSRNIDHPSKDGESLPQTFCFRGRVIMSFNDTPTNSDFRALTDRCVAGLYELDFDYEERIELIREVAKISGFSPLSAEEQQQVAEWIATVTNPAVEVSLRTLEHVCEMRHFGQEEDTDWQELAFEGFDLDHERYLIIRMRQDADMPVSKQVEYFKQETGKSETYYYDLLAEIKDERME